MAPIVKSFFAYCYLGQGHASLKFSDRNFNKNFGKKFPPRGGSDPQNFWKSGCIPSMVMCLQIFTPISLKLWLVGVCEHSKNAILAPLRLCPRAQGGPTPKIFFAYFFWVRAMTPLYFQIEIFKTIWEKFSPGGSDPQNFWKSGFIPPRVMCLQSFTQISLKLWPVDVC